MWKYLRGRNFLPKRAGRVNVCTVLRPASLVMELEATTVLEISRGRSHSSLPLSRCSRFSQYWAWVSKSYQKLPDFVGMFNVLLNWFGKVGNSMHVGLQVRKKIKGRTKLQVSCKQPYHAQSGSNVPRSQWADRGCLDDRYQPRGASKNSSTLSNTH